MSSSVPSKCTCGADARIRHRDPYVWVECKKKCGMKSGFIFLWIPDDKGEAEQFAVDEWNKKVFRMRNRNDQDKHDLNMGSVSDGKQ
jgi:hypothetical protein